jgi:hypothetical protein
MPKSSKDDPNNRAPLEDWLRGARKAAALKAALELEIFTRIAEGHRSLPALLRVSGLNERGARLLLDALANTGLLVRAAFEYSLTPTADTFLVKGKPTYHGDALLAQLAWEARGQTAKSVRSGKPAIGPAADGGTRLQATRTGANWADWQSSMLELGDVWDQLGVGTGTDTRVRALGFGVEAGLRLLLLAQRDGTTRIWIVDTPAAVALARSSAEAWPFKAQIEFLEGDWLSVALPARSFDLVLVDSITAYGNFEQNIGILHRAFEALEMGGRIVLRASMSDDDRNGPDSVPLIGLDLLLASIDGDIYTTTEYRGMLEAAGFFEVKQVGEQAGVLTARRIPSPPPLPAAPTIAPDFIPPPETLT